MSDWLLARVCLVVGGLALVALIVLMLVDRIRDRPNPPDDDDISGWGV